MLGFTTCVVTIKQVCIMVKVFIGSVFLLLCSVAHSYNMIYDASGNVTAIGNLDIDGVLYNVDFDSGVYGTFGGDEFFWADSGAEVGDISSQINVILNNEGAISVANGYGGGRISYGIIDAACWTPSCKYPSFFANYYNADIPEWRIQSGPLPEYYPDGRTAWSVAVPVPAAVWLFGSALAGLGWIRRKQIV